MKAITLKALQGSIKKWEKIVDGTGIDLAYRNCPLCDEFEANNCFGCPVEEAGGENCYETPYSSWIKAHSESGRREYGQTMHDDDTAIAAVLELEFLRSLLPSKSK